MLGLITVAIGMPRSCKTGDHMTVRRALFAAATVAASAASFANAETRIVSWNAEATMYETMEKRGIDIRKLDADLRPDVLILVEIAGREELERLIGFLGWPEYHAVMSDFDDIKDSAFTGLEVAVVSKKPIVSATEFDAGPDGDSNKVFGTFGELAVVEKQMSSAGISNVVEMARTDRGTLRVDLASGLTIFPAHLKANTNSACSNLTAMIDGYRGMGKSVPAELTNAQANGFDKATKDHLLNAVKRERVIAALKQLADGAVAEGKTVFVAGDFNTSFEPGKVGQEFADCTLENFTCDKGPFPADKCDGDGYDDTLAIMDKPLLGTTKWTFLTRNLGRTYDDDDFADLAIDHVAVPASQASWFVTSTKGAVTYGSDHFPVLTIYNNP